MRKALDEYVINFKHKALDSDTSKARRQQILLAEGITQELYSCSDASRAWTGYWENDIICRIERVAGIERLTKGQYLAPREILKAMYDVISQGENDIL